MALKAKLKQMFFSDQDMVNSFIFKEANNCVVARVAEDNKRARVRYRRGFRNPRLEIYFPFDNQANMNTWKRYRKTVPKREKEAWAAAVFSSITDLFPIGQGITFDGYVTSTGGATQATVSFTDIRVEATTRGINVINRNGNHGKLENGGIIFNVFFTINYTRPENVGLRDMDEEDQAIYAAVESEKNIGRQIAEIIPSKHATDGYIFVEKDPMNYTYELIFNTKDNVYSSRFKSIWAEHGPEAENGSAEKAIGICAEFLADTLTEEISRTKYNIKYNVVDNVVESNFSVITKFTVADIRDYMEDEDNPGYVIADIVLACSIKAK